MCGGKLGVCVMTQIKLVFTGNEIIPNDWVIKIHSIQVCHSTYSNFFRGLVFFGGPSDHAVLFVVEVPNIEDGEPGV